MCRNTSYSCILDKKTRGKILSLKAKCNHTPCTWAGELLDYERHIKDSCQQTLVPCSFGCGHFISRIELLNHEKNFCENRPLGAKVTGMQRLLLLKMMETESLFELETKTKNAQSLQFQSLFDRYYREISSHRNEGSSVDNSVQKTVSEFKNNISDCFRDSGENLTKLSSAFGETSTNVSQEMTHVVSDSSTTQKKADEETKRTLADVMEENTQLKEKSKRMSEKMLRIISIQKLYCIFY